MSTQPKGDTVNVQGKTFTAPAAADGATSLTERQSREENRTAPLQAESLTVGDLILCGVRFREVLAVDTLVSRAASGEPVELAVTVGDREGERRMVLAADLTVMIRDRNVGRT